jgi:hypothetical protein
MKILVFAFALFSGTALFAQSSTEWLYQRFSQEEANAIINAGGQKLAYYQFMNANGCVVSDVAPKDISTHPNALEVAGVKPNVPALTEQALLNGDFDCELYQWNRSESDVRYFRIANSSYLLMVQPNGLLRSKFTEQQ